MINTEWYKKIGANAASNREKYKICPKDNGLIPIEANFCPYCGFDFKRSQILKSKKRLIYKRIAIVLGVLLCVGIGVIFYSTNNKTKGQDSNLDLGNRYLLSGENDNAIDVFSKAIEIDGKDVSAYIGRGDAYKAKGDYANAWNDYETAQELSGDTTILRSKIGQTEILVLSEDGNSVSDALVKLSGNTHSYELNTDVNGCVSEILFPEEYDIEVFKENYDVLSTKFAAKVGEDTTSQLKIKRSKKEVVVAETALRMLNEAMSKYIFVVMTDLAYAEGDFGTVEFYDIAFSDAEKIRAAALASDSDGGIDNYFRFANGKIVLDVNVETGPNGNGYHGWSVSNQEVEDNCRNMFGTEASWNDLQSEAKSIFLDVVKYDDTSGTRALVIDSEAESELDLESHEYRIKESDDGYIGEVELYWGYWGELSQNPGLSNYLVTYKLKPNESSTYGLAVSSIRISCIVQDESEVLEENKEEQVINEVTDAPFYGIWCYASKDQNEAQKVASQLIELGFNAKVYICSEWSNLNQEMWYCVSADSCQTRAEAEIVQQAALDAGYSEAYIKYSGNYIGK